MSFDCFSLSFYCFSFLNMFSNVLHCFSFFISFLIPHILSVGFLFLDSTHRRTRTERTHTSLLAAWLTTVNPPETRIKMHTQDAMPQALTPEAAHRSSRAPANSAHRPRIRLGSSRVAPACRATACRRAVGIAATGRVPSHRPCLQARWSLPGAWKQSKHHRFRPKKATAWLL